MIDEVDAEMVRRGWACPYGGGFGEIIWGVRPNYPPRRITKDQRILIESLYRDRRAAVADELQRLKHGNRPNVEKVSKATEYSLDLQSRGYTIGVARSLAAQEYGVHKDSIKRREKKRGTQ